MCINERRCKSMNYKDCNVLCEIKRKEVPLISHVEIDEFTEMVQ